MTRWLNGWIAIMVLIAIVGTFGCARFEKTAADAYTGAPGAYEIPVMTLGVVPF